MVSFILILTLIFGMTSFVAYAEAAPETHSLPAFIDFEGEETGRYYNKEKMPKSFFNISSYNYISENTRTGNKYLSMQPTANVSSKNLIMFEDFKFDNTVDFTSPFFCKFSYNVEFIKCFAFFLARCIEA